MSVHLFLLFSMVPVTLVKCLTVTLFQVYLTGETASSFDEVEPSFFVTYEFFEHEIQATPVMKGKR